MLDKLYPKSIKVVVLVVLIASLLTAGMASNSSADEKGTEWSVSNSDNKNIPGKLEGYSKILSTLLVLIALAIGTIYVLKKKYGIKTSIGKGKRCLQITDHISMGAKKSIFLVKVPGKHILVGVTNDKINLITEIANEDVNNLESATTENINGSDFLSLMKKSYLGNKQKKK
jgi:flagellar biogenesis protein FliO